MEVKDSPMATGHDENESFDQRFGRLLDALLSNPPEETTTREQLAAFRDKLVGCLQEGRSRRLMLRAVYQCGRRGELPEVLRPVKRFSGRSGPGERHQAEVWKVPPWPGAARERLQVD